MKLTLTLLALSLAACHRPDGDNCLEVRRERDRLSRLAADCGQRNETLQAEKAALTKRIAELEAAQPKPAKRRTVGRMFDEYAAGADRYGK